MQKTSRSQSGANLARAMTTTLLLTWLLCLLQAQAAVVPRGQQGRLPRRQQEDIFFINNKWLYQSTPPPARQRKGKNSKSCKKGDKNCGDGDGDGLIDIVPPPKWPPIPIQQPSLSPTRASGSGTPAGPQGPTPQPSESDDSPTQPTPTQPSPQSSQPAMPATPGPPTTPSPSLPAPPNVSGTNGPMPPASATNTPTLTYAPTRTYKPTAIPTVSPFPTQTAKPTLTAEPTSSTQAPIGSPSGTGGTNRPTTSDFLTTSTPVATSPTTTPGAPTPTTPTTPTLPTTPPRANTLSPNGASPSTPGTPTPSPNGPTSPVAPTPATGVPTTVEDRQTLSPVVQDASNTFRPTTVPPACNANNGSFGSTLGTPSSVQFGYEVETLPNSLPSDVLPDLEIAFVQFLLPVLFANTCSEPATATSRTATQEDGARRRRRLEVVGVDARPPDTPSNNVECDTIEVDGNNCAYVDGELSFNYVLRGTETLEGFIDLILDRLAFGMDFDSFLSANENITRVSFVVGFGGGGPTDPPDRNSTDEINDTDDSDELPWWPWLLIGSVLFILCCGIIAYRRTRSGEDGAQYRAAPDGEDSAGDSNEGGPNAVYTQSSAAVPHEEGVPSTEYGQNSAADQHGEDNAAAAAAAPQFTPDPTPSTPAPAPQETSRMTEAQID